MLVHASPHFLQAVMGALLIAMWQAVLLVGFRQFVGKVELKEATTAAAEEAYQFTLRQGLYVIGSVAALLAVTQFLKWDGLNLRDIVRSVTFMLGFGAVLTVPAILAMWIAFRVEYPIRSCLLSVSSVLLVALVHCVADGLSAMTLQDRALLYAPALVVAFVVWCGLRYCRAHGFRLVKRLDVRAT